jgi:hypothetical protein
MKWTPKTGQGKKPPVPPLTTQGYADDEERGQLHHAISKKVYDELIKNPNLRDRYRYRDSRFATRAKDLQSHNGNETWHRNLDAEVVAWLHNHDLATPEEFEDYLRQRYNDADLLNRFPNGLK